MNDTPRQIEQRYQKMIMSRTPSERLTMACKMYDSGRKLVISGILTTGHQLTDAQLRGQIFMRMYRGDFSVAETKRIFEKIPNLELDPENKTFGVLLAE